MCLFNSRVTTEENFSFLNWEVLKILKEFSNGEKFLAKIFRGRKFSIKILSCKVKSLFEFSRVFYYLFKKFFALVSQKQTKLFYSCCKWRGGSETTEIFLTISKAASGRKLKENWKIYFWKNFLVFFINYNVWVQRV